MTRDAGNPPASRPADPGPEVARVVDPERVRALERLAHRTWPCGEEESLGPWLLRAAGGYSRRANSCLAIGPLPDGPEVGLEAVEAWYAARHLAPCLKETPLLDDATREELARRGWGVVTPSWVMTRSVDMDLPATPLPTGCAVEWQDVPSPAWSAALALWDGESPDVAAQHEALHQRMARGRFLSLRVGGSLAGVLVASSEGSSAHLYDLVIEPALRSRGLGKAFLSQALVDLCERGTVEVVLQVLKSNVVAVGLYRSLGFAVEYGYGYREGAGP